MKTISKTSKITADILDTLPSPCWILEEHLLIQNLETLRYIKEQTGAKILLALKGYSLWSTFDIVSKYLDGCCASGLHEAMLADEKFGKEVHTYSPAFRVENIGEIAALSHHLVFNSPTQLKSLSTLAKKVNQSLSIGIRVNPECSSSPVAMYDPCGIYSRLGTISKNIDSFILDNIDGLHFHALCEQDASALESVLEAFEDRFGIYLPQMKWVNFGGGHHITRKGYDTDKLIRIISDFKRKYPHLEIYLEPGEAIGWETGVLVSTVLDIVQNDIDIAILDTSAEAHMPDTIIMPYRADVRDSAEAGQKPYTYRLAGNTCLAGDIMGDYSFDEPLRVGDKVIFEDQMHYTMVKATTFNGIPLPSIAILRENGKVELVKEFGYDVFKERLS